MQPARERRRVPWLRPAAQRDVDLPAGAASGVGSLPHLDVTAAVRCSLDLTPDLPAAPQLSHLHHGATMVCQWLCHVPGISLGDDGCVAVDVDALPDGGANVVPDFSHPVHTGLVEFLDEVVGRTLPIKLQLTGPVTLSLALVDGGVPRNEAIDLAERVSVSSARALVERARVALPEVPILVCVDEPGLVACAHPGFPLRRRRVRSAITGIVEAIASADTYVGIHCCGPTDWQPVVAAGPDLLSFPVDAMAPSDYSVLARFIRGGGWIAWGAVPTDGPLGDGSERLADRLTAAIDAVAEAGVDAGQVAKQSIVTPACGLANHDVAQAEHLLEITAAVAGHVRASVG